ncbi:MAG: aminotransferase class I/II-fold pyridoxal phosphate-dependent enzyme [Alphaproteobacteria bacterium]|nr:aminotransferase class I/II-fold pyridoxal phosphate-dependent enzyme [Alphaproteobacteria bacterium]
MSTNSAKAAAVAVADDAPILFFDLKSQAKRLRADIEQRLMRVLDHGAYIGGPEVAEVEAKLASYSGVKHGLAVASGTDALVIALMGEEVGPGDAVFIPGFTYNATCNAVLLAGATPVFVDVDPHTCNIDAKHLEAQIEATLREGKLKPRMVVAVDLYGLPADYTALNKLAAKHGMLVLADAAQSFGGGQDGRAVGILTDMTATSFYPSKTVGAYGDGGAMFTDDTARFERWASIRWHGTDAAKRESIRVGINGRLDSMQCAVVLSKLSIFDDEMKVRRHVAKRYREGLGNSVEVQHVPRGTESAWGLFTIQVDNREAVQKRLADAGVPSSIYYFKGLHQHQAFSRFAPKGGLPVCERLAQRVLSLPMHPYLTDPQLDRVIAAVKAAV